MDRTSVDRGGRMRSASSIQQDNFDVTSPSAEDSNDEPPLNPTVNRARTWNLADSSPNTAIRRRGTTTSFRPRNRSLVRRATGTSFGNEEQFSLAGPQDVVAVAPQHYVDPGYAQLNPAYSQPLHAKPVWSLAKPLPRVVRPGMVPTASELDTINNQAGDTEITEGDVEQGPEPTLRLGRVTSKLQAVRAERERRFVEGRSGSKKLGRARADSQSSLHSQNQQLRRENSAQQGSTVDVLPDVAEEHEPMDHEQFPDYSEGPFDPSPSYRPTYEFDDSFSAKTALDTGLSDDDLTLTHNNLEDEVYNAHTHWSIIRHRFRHSLAEFLACFVQLTLGFSADLAVTMGGAPANNAIFGSLAWGFATMIGIYIAGGPSGAHLNPVITIVLYIFRGFPKRHIGSYIAAQFLGALAAGFVTYAIFSSQMTAFIANPTTGTTEVEATQSILNAFVTGLRNDNVTLACGYFSEFVATAFLALIVLALGDDTNAPPGAGTTALILGFVICVLLQAFASNTGAAINPTRDLGPRIALWALGFSTDLLWKGNWWLWGPWLACVPGGIAGALAYDICIFEGGESPVNYPQKRIWRAGHKTKKKWARRLRPWKGGKGRKNKGQNQMEQKA
ncbi:aquaporin-like protein [Aureobasidium sp. EXF-3400]|nr:aquaporin-like protein [Aureobasidium sp. EXF-12344]KAI4780745.1 aquaporin-like protein [Aureobasidium sp. EXF-3400]